MNDKPDAWMPLYVADWDADTAHLDCEQDGAYGRLVRYYWRTGPLPDDDAQLARIVRMSLPRWRKVRPAIAKLFRVAGGLWKHKRVDAELAGAAARKKKAIERAEKGAKARWGDARSNASRNAPSTPQALLEDMLEECPSPSPSPLVGEGSNKPSPPQRRESARASQEARASRAPAIKPIPEPDHPSAEIVQLAERAGGSR